MHPQQAILASEPSVVVIGRWSEALPDYDATSKLTIYQRDGKVSIEREINDRDTQTIELKETITPTIVRYDVIPESETGDYFLVDESGELQSWNKAGLISTAKRVRK